MTRYGDVVPVAELGRHEQARRAITEARKLSRNWQAMARMMTRNSKIVVKLHAGDTSCTDGETIWIRVPIELGEEIEHDRSLCGRRDSDFIQLCSRCAILEDVNITVIHEVAHIAHDTFKAVDPYEVSFLLERAVESECENRPDSKRARLIKARIDQADERLKRDYLNLANLVSPYLPAIINACEDIRVNNEMRVARPGTEVMFLAQTNSVFDRGWKMADGSTRTWLDAPPNGQAVIGIYCLTNNTPIRGRLSDEVVDKLESSPTIVDLCNKMRESQSVRDVYRLSYPLLEELRRLGFCRLPDEPEDDLPPEETPSMDQESDPDENGDNDDTEDQESGDGPGGDAGESDDSDGDSSGTDQGEGNGGGGNPEPGEGALDSDSDSGDEDSSDSVPPEVGSGDDQEDDDSTDGTSSGDSNDPIDDDSGGEGGSSDGGDQDDDGAGHSDSTGESSEEASGSGPADGPSDPVREDGERGDSSPVPDSDDGGSSPDQDSPSDEDGRGSDSDTVDDRTGSEGSDQPGDSESSNDGTDDEGQREGNQSPQDDSSDGQGSDTGGTAEADLPESDSAGSTSTGDASDGDTSSVPNGAGNSDGGSDRPTDPAEQSSDLTDEPAGTGGTPFSQPESDEVDPDTGDPVDGDSTADKDSGEAAAPSLPPPDPEVDGTPDDIEQLLRVFGRHEPQADNTPSGRHEEHANTEAIEMALEQMDHFDKPSLNIAGVKIHEHDRTGSWLDTRFNRGHRSRGSIDVPERILTASLQRMRLAFVENRRGKIVNNLFDGKVDGRTLGRKVPTGDERVFRKKVQPGRRDYFVVVGVDCSGSTAEEIGGGMIRLDMMKAAVAAQCELLHRLGIPFAVYGHSGNYQSLAMFVIKNDKEPWGKGPRKALEELQPYSANLDGHSLEFYRKVAERRTETDKLILYYTDGAMPLANYDEELEILQREIVTCQKLQIRLVGIGVNSDSPKEHGLDTILLDTLDDVPKVVTELRKRLVPR